jgi:predicted SAM-dependent methyltransferase
MRRQIKTLEIFPGPGRAPSSRDGLPRHTAVALAFELGLDRIRKNAAGMRRRYASARGLLVNIGAGSHGKAGWVNVDVAAHPNVDCLYDCRRSLPFADRSVRGIFCEHFLEHLDYTEEVPYFLSECLRVLEPGGVIRIVVPDIRRYMEAYVRGGWKRLEKIRPLKPGRRDAYFGCRYNTRMELLNVVLRQGHQHKFGYDLETLRFLLERYGFARIARRGFGRSASPELLLDVPFRASESLYVEAARPGRRAALAGRSRKRIIE